MTVALGEGVVDRVFVVADDLVGDRLALCLVRGDGASGCRGPVGVVAVDWCGRCGRSAVRVRGVLAGALEDARRGESAGVCVGDGVVGAVGVGVVALRAARVEERVRCGEGGGGGVVGALVETDVAGGVVGSVEVAAVAGCSGLVGGGGVGVGLGDWL